MAKDQAEVVCPPMLHVTLDVASHHPALAERQVKASQAFTPSSAEEGSFSTRLFPNNALALKNEGHAMRTSFPKWLIYSLLAVLSWGLFGFLSKLGSEKLSPVQMQLMVSAGIVAMTVPAWFRSEISKDTSKLGLLYGVFTGFFSVAANLAVFAALKKGQASVIQPATGLYPLVTVILAVIILKERMNSIQIGGIILALIALWILSL